MDKFCSKCNENINDFDFCKNCEEVRATKLATEEVGVGSPKLMTGEDFKKAFLGLWSVPAQNFNGSYATHEQSANNKDVFVKGRPSDHMSYAVVLPPKPVVTNNPNLVPIANLKSWKNMPLPKGLVNMNGIHQYGILQKEDRIFVTFKPFYSVSGVNHPSQAMIKDGLIYGCYKLADSSGKDANNLYHHNKVAGYICRPPKSIKADYLVGLCGTPGSAISSCGPSLYAVNFDSSLSDDACQKAQPLVSFDHNKKMNGWDNITSVRGAAWIETKNYKAVIFTARKSVGEVWYGLPKHNVNGKILIDPWSSNKGYHAENYGQGFWIFDPDDILAVYNGTKNCDDVEPKEWVDLRDLGLLLNDSNRSGWITSSFRDGRLIIGVGEGLVTKSKAKLPLFLEFDLDKTI